MKSTLAKYKIVHDGVYSHICELEPDLRIPADNNKYFKTLSLAKKELKSEFKYYIDSYKSSLKNINKMIKYLDGRNN